MNEIAQDLNTEQLVGHYKKHIDRTYIGSHDLMKEDGSFRTVTVTLSGIHKRDIYNPGKKKHEKRLVATFEVGEKQFIINATNCKAIEQIAGTPMTDKWVGSKIMLTVQKVKVGREMVDAIRVKHPVTQ